MNSLINSIREDEMKTLLQINTSLNTASGHSTRLADEFVDSWRASHPGAKIIKRDLASEPVPHLTGERFGAFLSKPEARTAEEQAVVAYSDALIDELKRADVIVLAAPMYNFAVPSTLKAYFDHIARAGVTFKYTASGSVGLLGGKKVYVIATRGGKYAGTPADTQTSYVRQFLGFIGLGDVEFVYAEGLAIDEATRNAAIAEARSVIAGLTREDWPLAA